MDHRDRSVRGYDRLASVYRPLECGLFGNALQQSRVAMIDRLPRIDRALVLGDGDGRLIEKLCLTQPGCRLTSVEQSGAMVEQQRRRIERIGATDRVRLLRQDARNFCTAHGEYDLLVAAYFLDCFLPSELEQSLPRWLDTVRQGGHFYFADFVQPPAGWRRIQSTIYQTLMHLLFRWQTGLPNRRLVDLDAVLHQQSIRLVDAAQGLHPMMTCRIYRCVRTGCHY